jgi:hypothetical protein
MPSVSNCVGNSTRMITFLRLGIRLSTNLSLFLLHSPNFICRDWLEWHCNHLETRAINIEPIILKDTSVKLWAFLMNRNYSFHQLDDATLHHITSLPARGCLQSERPVGDSGGDDRRKSLWEFVTKQCNAFNDRPHATVWKNVWFSPISSDSAFW